MQTELTRPYSPVWVLHVCSFALPRLRGGMERSFWKGVAMQGVQRSVHLCPSAFLTHQLPSQNVPPSTLVPEGGDSGIPGLGWREWRVAVSCWCSRLGWAGEVGGCPWHPATSAQLSIRRSPSPRTYSHLVVFPDCRDLCFSPERSCDQVPDELHWVPEEDAFQLQRTGAQR